MKFRKKPLVIEAVQWNESLSVMRQLEKAGMDVMGYSGHIEKPDLCHSLRIRTLEGTLHVSPGDWIIQGVKGEFYPCKPDIFAATYELAASPAEGPTATKSEWEKWEE